MIYNRGLRYIKLTSIKVGSGLAISGGVLSTDMSTTFAQELRFNTWYAASSKDRLIFVKSQSHMNMTVRVSNTSSSSTSGTTVAAAWDFENNGYGACSLAAIVPAGRAFCIFDNDSSELNKDTTSRISWLSL